jgi:hypothetical protein
MSMCCTYNMVLLYSDTRFQNVILRLLLNQVVYSSCKLAVSIPTDSDISYKNETKIVIVNKRIHIVVVDGQVQRKLIRVTTGTCPKTGHFWIIRRWRFICRKFEISFISLERVAAFFYC